MNSKPFYRVTDLRCEYLTRPLGLDIERPRISWRLEAESGVRGLTQAAYRLQVGTKPGLDDVWDTGRVESDRSAGVPWEGPKLLPKTRYHYTVTVWDAAGAEASASDWFETGFLDPDVRAWGGAEWIGAPERYLMAKAMGVFVLTSEITIPEGSTRAGIVFGARDGRLADSRRNIYRLAGESEIRFVLDVAPEIPVIEIWRIGYAPEDTSDAPFAVIPVVSYETKEPVISPEDRHRGHTLRIEIPGNGCFTYVDGVLIDAVDTPLPFAPDQKTRSPRQLNPLGANDVNTFPRLCCVGFRVEAGQTAAFSGLTISNYRTPKAVVAQVPGLTLSGGEDGRSVLTDPSAHSIPMLRSDFSVPEGKRVRSARLYITARGIYDCAINGQAVTDTCLNPGHTQYDRHLLYQTYDVTALLHSGANGIGITLASGWWADSQTFQTQNYNYYGDQEAVLARLEVRYEDGTTDALVTNTEDWQYYGEGPYRYSGFFQGEHFDARRKWIYDEYSLPGFTIDGLKQPAVITPAVIEATYFIPGDDGYPWPRLDHSRTKLVGSYNAPVRVVRHLTAKTVTNPRPGLYIYDLGQECAGVPCIRLKGAAGTEAIIRYGEMLYPNLPEYSGLEDTLLTENYRDAESIDRYIFRGDPEGELFRPRFTFHGFRYIEITGVEEPPLPEDVSAVQYSSVELTGTLETDHPLVNRLIENVGWSQMCNFISIPTDCPQRNERMGWAGDAHAFARTATFLSDARIFYYRYLEALRDLQQESGKLPAIAPAGGGFGGITYEVAMPFIVWELYQQYGDREVVAEFYPAMRKWFSYASKKGLPGNGFMDSLPDWLAQENTDPSLMFNCFYGYAAHLLKQFALLIGETEDAAWYERVETETRDYWNRTFFDPERGVTLCADGSICDTQTSYALPIMYGMLAPEYIEAACAALDRRTKETGCRVMTGFFGTGLLNPALTRGGYTDTACSLLKQTDFPSWLYPVTQGATTIWERWNSFTLENGFGGNNSMNSFNHYSLGSVLSWIYETLCGVRRDEENPGYRHFTLAPIMTGFGRVEGSFRTPYGTIESGWRVAEGTAEYRCTVPPNTTASLRLPDGTAAELGSGTYRFTVALP